MAVREMLDKQVFTPLGRGRVVYVMPDETLVVELQHGSGHIFRAEELMLQAATRYLGKPRSRNVCGGSNDN